MTTQDLAISHDKIIEMIKSNELRIGNWIRDKEVGYKDDFQVRAADIVTIALGKTEYHPIPLTPEILIACGFKKDPDDCLSLNKIFYWLGFVQIAIGYAPLINLKHLKYLHQLQNLYFDFYNAELEYKP